MAQFLFQGGDFDNEILQNIKERLPSADHPHFRLIDQYRLILVLDKNPFYSLLKGY